MDKVAMVRNLPIATKKSKMSTFDADAECDNNVTLFSATMKFLLH